MYFAVAPSIVVPPVSTVQQLNSAPLSLSCTADGFPLPIINWIRVLSNGSETVFPVGITVVDGRSFDVSNTVISMMTRVESVFLINATNITGTSRYVCIASNSLGNALFVVDGEFQLLEHSSVQS